MNAIQERLRKMNPQDFIRTIDEFNFDEAHGFIDDEYGDNESDIYLPEIDALFQSVKNEPTKADALYRLCIRSYKMGFMRANQMI